MRLGHPIDNIKFNAVKAGRGIPLEFTLNGNYGLKILASGYPVSLDVPCTSKNVGRKELRTETTGNNQLSYGASTDRYRFVWNTDKKLAGTCRHLALKIKDGSTHTAYFQFK